MTSICTLFERIGLSRDLILSAAPGEQTHEVQSASQAAI